LISIADRSLTEGDVGSSNMTFTVTLGWAQDAAVIFDYRTADGTATAGVDYTATSGSKTINAGSLTTTIDVPILGDTSDESDETFTLYISNPRYV
jgi:fibronectin-binding autotransporter adhesin